MHVTVFTTFDSLPDSLVARWSYPAEPRLFLSLDWFRCLFNGALRNELAPRIYCISNDAGVVLGVLCCAVGKKRRQLVSFTNFYSLEFSASLPGELVERQEVIDRLVDHIAGERPRWASLEFRYLRKNDPVFHELTAALRRHGFVVNHFHQYENWYLSVGDRSFAMYVSERPSVIRKTLPRSERKLKDAFKVEIRLISQPGSEMEGAMRDYLTVYDRSWKKAEPYEKFIPALINTCAGLGILSLGVLCLDGQPVAAQIWIVTERKALIYKVAYDEQFKKLSVGSILSAEMFRSAIDTHRVQEIDYGVGSDPYKKDWMEAARLVEGIEGFNSKTLVGRLLSLRLAIKRLVKGSAPQII